MLALSLPMETTALPKFTWLAPLSPPSVAVETVKARVPVLMTTVLFCRAAGLPTVSVPALTWVLPLYESLPERVSSPAPFIVTPPLPLPLTLPL